jgi:hypothetical protein
MSRLRPLALLVPALWGGLVACGGSSLKPGLQSTGGAGSGASVDAPASGTAGSGTAGTSPPPEAGTGGTLALSDAAADVVSSSASDGGALGDAPGSDAVSLSEAGTDVTGPEGDAAPYHALAVTTGVAHTCAVLDDGHVKCWGLNLEGELGYGDTYRRGSVPADMGDNLPFVDLGQGRLAKAIAAGGDATCAILDDGTVKCWGGADLLGLPGAGTQNRGDEPGEMGDALPALDFGPGRHAVQVALGVTVACALLDDGSVSCWGKGAGTLTPSPVTLASSFNPTTAPVRALSGTSNGMLVLFTDGTVTRLFEPSTVPFLAPNVQATAVRGFGIEGECALVNGGVISCIISLGPPYPYAQSIDGADSFYSYVVGSDGSVEVGRNLGPNAYASPVPLPSLVSFGMVSLGMCAIYPDGSVGCQKFFESNSWPCTPDWCVPSTAPNDGTIFIQLGQKAVDLTSGGGWQICALLANGEVRCWASYMATDAPVDAIGSSFDLVETNGMWSYGPFHSIDLGTHH